MVDAPVARSLSSISTLQDNTNYQNDVMQSEVSAAVAAMEQAVRRLDAALAQRGAAFRRLNDQHGAMTAELRSLREELQSAQAEAAALRERAALVDALREELAQLQQDGEAASGGEKAGDDGLRQALADRDAELAALRSECADLRARLHNGPEAARGSGNGNGQDAANPAELAALKAELAASQAAQAEMQAFQNGIAARLEATMARLRQALGAEAL